MPAQEDVLPQTPTLPVWLAKAAPGVALSLSLAGAAVLMRHLPGVSILSPSALAILLGIGLRQVTGAPAFLQPGLALSVRVLLRLAVVLLGLQVTLGQVAALGFGALIAVAAGLVACYSITVWLGGKLGVAPRLTRLIAIGTAVCGASAVVAGNSVIKGEDEDVGYALATVTLFGTVAMLGMPLAALALGLDHGTAGLWLGASIHEVAQVVGAATQLDVQTVQTATVAKMARVLMLAPLVLTLAALGRAKSHGDNSPKAKVPVPWFVFGFLALAAIASLGVVPAAVTQIAGQTSAFLLATALAAMGFGMNIRALLLKGVRPLILAIVAWGIISGVSLGLLVTVG